MPHSNPETYACRPHFITTIPQIDSLKSFRDRELLEFEIAAQAFEFKDLLFNISSLKRAYHHLAVNIIIIT